MKTHVSRIVRAAQTRNERLSAYMRLAVVAVLLASFIPVRDQFPWSSLPVIILMGYGLVSLLSLALAEAGVFRPWLPWLYAALDMLILFAFLIALTQFHGVPLREAFRVPGAAMIFLFLGQAALRYQPALVLFTGALYLVFWLVVTVSFEESDEAIVAASTAELPLQVEVLRLAITVLVALLLALLSFRTRRLLQSAIVEARSKSNLAKYLPANLVREMADNGIRLIEKSRRQAVAVLFVDIRNFTGMSEAMDPGAVTDLLTEFRRRMTRVILSRGGSLDKFIGDAIMVEFGIPESGKSDARDALLCGVDMLRTLESWNKGRAGLGLPAVEAGIGAHYGEVIAGAFGDEARLEYTVIGDTVNTAERIERHTRQAGVPMLVSAALLGAAGEPPAGVTCTALPPRGLRGRQRPISLSAIELAEDLPGGSDERANSHAERQA